MNRLSALIPATLPLLGVLRLPPWGEVFTLAYSTLALITPIQDCKALQHFMESIRMTKRYTLRRCYVRWAAVSPGTN